MGINIIWQRENNKKIVLILLTVLLSTFFVYIWFSFLPTIVADSVGYYSYMDILRGERAISEWNYLRGPSFPLILYTIFTVFGDTPLGFLFGSLFFWILCVFLCLWLFKLVGVIEKGVSCKFVFFLILFLLILNPLIIGFYHAMLTEFVACTLTILAIFLSYRWIDLPVSNIRSALFYMILFPALAVILWFLKQPYLFCLLIPLSLAFILGLIRKNTISTLFYKISTILLVLFSVWYGAKVWNRFLINNGGASSVQSENFISAITKSGLTNFSVASLEKQSLDYIERNRFLFNNNDLIELGKIADSTSKYEQYEVVELKEKGEVISNMIVFWNNSAKIFETEPVAYYLTILRRHPFKVLQGYIDNYLTVINFYGCGNTNWTNYYPIKELKDWSCENRSIGLSTYETDLVAYDSNTTDWKSGNNDMSQYELINTPIPWVQKIMNILAEPALQLFKISLLLSPFLFLFSLVGSFLFKENQEYKSFYQVMTLLFGYSFLYVLMNALTGALIDRYAFVPYVMSIIGIIVLLEFLRRRNSSKINKKISKLRSFIKQHLFCISTPSKR